MSRVWEVVTVTDILKMVLIWLLGWTCLAAVLGAAAIFLGGDLSINETPWSEVELDFNLVLQIVAGAIFTVLFSTLSFFFGRMVLIFLMAIVPEKTNKKT